MQKHEITPFRRTCILEKLTNPNRVRELSIVPTISSTNTKLKESLKNKTLQLTNEQPYSILLAEEQTAGRGRLGRSFYSPAGCGIYVSIAIKLNTISLDVMEITTAASVAICKALEEAGFSPQIKWVNDIYIKNKKICGILAEGITNGTTGKLENIILGIGINYLLVPDELSDDLVPIVDALYHSGTKESNVYSRSDLTGMMLHHLFSILEHSGQESNYIEDYKKRSLVLGKEIHVIQGGTTRKAMAMDIDSHGGLVIKEEDGSTSVLSTGEISIRLVAPE